MTTQQIKDYLINWYNSEHSQKFSTDINAIEEILEEYGTDEERSEHESHRHWDELTITKTYGSKRFSYPSAYTTGDLTPYEKGWEFDWDSVKDVFIPELFVCFKCGSKEIESKMWVGINDNIPREDVYDQGDHWCRECQEPTQIVTQKDYENSLEEFIFVSRMTVTAKNEEDAKEWFADNSIDFANNAKIEN